MLREFFSRGPGTGIANDRACIRNGKLRREFLEPATDKLCCIRFRAELDRLVAMAQERGLADDPIIRQKLAWCHSKVEIMRMNGMRTLTRFLAGHHPGPDGAISKLSMTP